MTSRTLYDEQIISLTDKVNKVYQTAYTALETKKNADALVARQALDQLDSDLLEKVNNEEYTQWNRNTKRAGLFDPFILPFVVSDASIEYLKDGSNEAAKAEDKITFKEVMTVINGKKSYSKIEDIAIQLANNGQFSTVSKVLKKIESTYKPKEVEQGYLPVFIEMIISGEMSTANR